MSPSADLPKAPEVSVTLVFGGTGRRVMLDIAKLEPASIKILWKLQPRMLDADFYAKLSLPERLIDMTPHRILTEHGNLHKPFETCAGNAVPAQFGQTDEIFQVGRFGNPRDPETVVRWLAALATRINQATYVRLNADIADRDALDADIKRWIMKVEAKAQSKPALFQDPDIDVSGKRLSWKLAFDVVPLHDDPRRRRALEKRMIERRQSNGYDTNIDWLDATHPLLKKDEPAAAPAPVPQKPKGFFGMLKAPSIAPALGWVSR